MKLTPTREAIVQFVRGEFTRRQQERRRFEGQWRLNMAFVAGRQYADLNARGAIETLPKEFVWQEREVFNHLAPILESRLSKLGRVRPKMAVLPAGADDSDLYNARTATAILDAAAHRLRLSEVISAATHWSEVCGTAFYKLAWEEDDVAVVAVPPFEVYPDRTEATDVEGCRSLLHARSYTPAEIRDRWGASVAGENGDGTAVVLEYYEMPSKTYENGRYILVAGDILVTCGDLPCRIGADGAYALPYARQVAVAVPGCFWGVSVIERAIPVQRAYNAVKNRKHELLNRLAEGVLAVEEGSVDLENLREEGLEPGKVLVYRQGSSLPRFLDGGHVPGDFTLEEDRLMNEFIYLSGVSELMRHSSVPANMTSGVALQLLIEQDDTRISITAESIRSAIRVCAQGLLRLYKQFASVGRVARVVGENGAVELVYWKKSNITCDDVSFVSENELSDTPAQKRAFVMDLLRAGLLADENGKLSNRMRAKVLDLLGFGMWENGQDLEALQIKAAVAENMELQADGTQPVVRGIDDHDVHVAEHVKCMLGGEFVNACKNTPKIAQIMEEHIKEHKAWTMNSQSATTV
ncbi:MAG: hypothetical protein LBM78_02435 [Clostridiales bacterium]|jgi:hypothetical protein|nr:hypothetical protein [Clostridiales bacterium]